jgi:hypothetical protein
MDRTTSSERSEAFVQAMTERMATVARSLSAWVQAEQHTLETLEQQVVRVLHDLGSTLLTALVPLAAPARPAPDVACPCGETARYVRERPATATTLLGSMTFTRALYHCAVCGQYQVPFDAQLQVAAGGLSLGLQELLALLGATQDSFAEASSVLERLTLVHVSPNSVRAATENLGQLLVAQEEKIVEQAQRSHTPPPSAQNAPARLYLSMDGVLAHIHEAGFKELKTGSVYTTCARRSRKQPEKTELHAIAQSYVVGLCEAETFGWQLWAEACRRGLTPQTEVVVLGDGAHWIWNIAETHFPNALQIVDWYHASSYVWNAATAIFGEGGELRKHWAHEQLDALWEGRVSDVLVALEPFRAKGEGVTEAMSYYTTHQRRMDYPSYRARGVQIGSGTIESACKQLVSARLKLAGMIWDAQGAEAVAVVRAWLKSERWSEAMRLRPAPHRTYRRQSIAPLALAPAA